MRVKVVLCMLAVDLAVPSGNLLEHGKGMPSTAMRLRGGLDYYPDSSWDDEHKHLHPDRMIFDYVQDQFDRFDKNHERYDYLKQLVNGTMALMEKALQEEKKRKQAIKEESSFSLSDIVLDDNDYESEDHDPFDIHNAYVAPNKEEDMRLLKHMKLARWLTDRRFNERACRALHDSTMKTKHYNFRCMSAVELYHYQGRKLMEAAKFGELDEMTRLIESGVSVNHQDIVRDSPLHWAAMQGRLRAVQLLISRGADVDLQTERGRTALHHAVAISNTRIVYELLKGGADPNIQDRSRFNPLDLAIHIRAHDKDLATLDNDKIIEMLRETKAVRTRESSPSRSDSPPPKEVTGMSFEERLDFLDNQTEGKVYDILSPCEEVRDEGDPIVVYDENMTDSRWESFCSEAEKCFPEEVRREAQRYIDEAVVVVGSKRKQDKVARNKQEKKTEKVVPLWKKKGPLTMLERERIDALGKKAMTLKERKRLNLPRPGPKKR